MLRPDVWTPITLGWELMLFGWRVVGPFRFSETCKYLYYYCQGSNLINNERVIRLYIPDNK